MKTHTLSPVASENHDTTSLVERMDPALGEATSMMGAVMTELMRRSLRGGVMKIEEELHAYVADQVDATLTERKPAIEQFASLAASRAAETVAAEIAGKEVQALESWTKEATHDLASQLVDTERRVTTQIVEVEKKTGEATRTAEQQLAAQIAEAERRASELARSEIATQVEDLMQKSRKGAALWEAKHKALETSLADLGRQLTDQIRQTEADRRADGERLREDLVRVMAENLAQLQDELRKMRDANQALGARVAELEKPRGLRAKLTGLFGRGKHDKPENAGEA